MKKILIALSTVAILTGCGPKETKQTNNSEGVYKTIVKVTYEYNDTAAWGSGVVIASDGLVVTNNHVISEDDYGSSLGNIGVCLTKSISAEPECNYKAELIVRNEDLDLALVKIISGENFDFMDIQESPYEKPEDVELGAKISVYGYPGVGGSLITLTTGVVSGLDLKQNIKTDTEINHGNSGGGAFAQDKFIGIPSFYISESADKLGYIIPYYTISKWIDGIVKNSIKKINAENINSDNIEYGIDNLKNDTADKALIEKFNEVQRRLQENEYNGLADRLNEIQEKRPQSPLVYEYIGMYYSGVGDCKTALDYFKISIALNPNKISALGNYGVCLMNLNRTEEALKVFEDVLNQDPENRTAIINIQFAYNKLGKGEFTYTGMSLATSKNYPGYPIKFNINKYDSNVETVQAQLN
ncbi:MAG: trypsin-like peptidase domain-containing protein [Patescibacteria group bacterium]